MRSIFTSFDKTRAQASGEKKLYCNSMPTHSEPDREVVKAQVESKPNTCNDKVKEQESTNMPTGATTAESSDRQRTLQTTPGPDQLQVQQVDSDNVDDGDSSTPETSLLDWDEMAARINAANHGFDCNSDTFEMTEHDKHRKVGLNVADDHNQDGLAMDGSVNEETLIKSDNKNDNINDISVESSTTMDTGSDERPNFSMGDHIYYWKCHFSVNPVQQYHAIVVDVVRLWPEQGDSFDCSSNHDDAHNISNDNDAIHRQNSIDESTAHSRDDLNESNYTESLTDNESNSRSGDSHVADNTNNQRLEWYVIIAEWSASAKRLVLRRLSRQEWSSWHKVKYNVSALRRHTRWSGTCTTADRSPKGQIRARVEFALWYTSTQLYNDDNDSDNSNSTIESEQRQETELHSENKKDSQIKDQKLYLSSPAYVSEAWAVWCSTGTWATLQMTSWLWTLAAGQVKSTATLAGMAATTTVTVPAAGLWGWLGYTTQVAWLSTQPWWIPLALAGYGVVTVGVPTILLKQQSKRAQEQTQRLNQAFGEYALVNAEQYAQKMMEWSEAE